MTPGSVGVYAEALGRGRPGAGAGSLTMVSAGLKEKPAMAPRKMRRCHLKGGGQCGRTGYGGAQSALLQKGTTAWALARAQWVPREPAWPELVREMMLHSLEACPAGKAQG